MKINILVKYYDEEDEINEESVTLDIPVDQEEKVRSLIFRTEGDFSNLEIWEA